MLAGCLALFVAGAAGAQTTSTTSTSTTSTSSSTTTSSTTTTTLVNPCAGQPCTAQPPTAFLAGSGGEVRLEPEGYCWRQVDGLLTRCVAFSAPPGGGDPSQTLVVLAGEALSLRFAIGMAPTSVSLTRAGEQPRALAPTNPTVLPVDLAPGIFTVGFVTGWLQGDATYSVRLDVRSPAPTATPQPGRVALTG